MTGSGTVQIRIPMIEPFSNTLDPTMAETPYGWMDI